MELVINFNNDDLDKKAEKFKILGNPVHLKIILILNDGEKSANEIHQILEECSIIKNRTSTYKAIQKLVNVDIVEIKKYVFKGRKRIIYYLKK